MFNGSYLGSHTASFIVARAVHCIHLAQFNLLSVTDVWSTLLRTFVLFVSMQCSTVQYTGHSWWKPIRKISYGSFRKKFKIMFWGVAVSSESSMSESRWKLFPTPNLTCYVMVCVICGNVRPLSFPCAWVQLLIELRVYL